MANFYILSLPPLQKKRPTLGGTQAPWLLWCCPLSPHPPWAAQRPPSRPQQPPAPWPPGLLFSSPRCCSRPWAGTPGPPAPLLSPAARSPAHLQTGSGHVSPAKTHQQRPAALGIKSKRPPNGRLRPGPAPWYGVGWGQTKPRAHAGSLTRRSRCRSSHHSCKPACAQTCTALSPGPPGTWSDWTRPDHTGLEPAPAPLAFLPLLPTPAHPGASPPGPEPPPHTHPLTPAPAHSHPHPSHTWAVTCMDTYTCSCTDTCTYSLTCIHTHTRACARHTHTHAPVPLLLTPQGPAGVCPLGCMCPTRPSAPWSPRRPLSSGRGSFQSLDRWLRSAVT